MDRNEILNMPAGQEMDMLVSSFVLRLTTEQWNKIFFSNLSKFSTDTTAAWMIVKKLTDDGVDVELRTSVRGWMCELHCANVKGSANAETAPLAICRAALIAELERP